jgi:hypothetical protein
MHVYFFFHGGKGGDGFSFGVRHWVIRIMSPQGPTILAKLDYVFSTRSEISYDEDNTMEGTKAEEMQQ